MDQAKLLREEARSPYSIFQQVITSLPRCSGDALFAFFEGEEDPVFYVNHLLHRIGEREYHEFICYGRSPVLKVQQLCDRDGRIAGRSIYFIDRDHSDIVSPEKDGLPRAVFETSTYSFENYLVCDPTFRRFWTERLHLLSTDSRFDKELDNFRRAQVNFLNRMRLLMAMLLIGRGVDTFKPVKLNLNNVDLSKIIQIDHAVGTVRWTNGAGKSFLQSSNMFESGIAEIRGDKIRQVFRKHLRDKHPKTYVRGKYELWFFVKLLTLRTSELSNKKHAAKLGLPRATPKSQLSMTNAVETIASLAPCPQDLAEFLTTRLA